MKAEKIKVRVKLGLFADWFGYWQLLQSPGCSLFISSKLIKLLTFKLSFLPSLLPSSPLTFFFFKIGREAFNLVTA